MLLVSQAGTFIGFLVMARAETLWVVFLARAIDGATAGNLDDRAGVHLRQHDEGEAHHRVRSHRHRVRRRILPRPRRQRLALHLLALGPDLPGRRALAHEHRLHDVPPPARRRQARAGRRCPRSRWSSHLAVPREHLPRLLRAPDPGGAVRSVPPVLDRLRHLHLRVRPLRGASLHLAGAPVHGARSRTGVRVRGFSRDHRARGASYDGSCRASASRCSSPLASRRWRWAMLRWGTWGPSLRSWSSPRCRRSVTPFFAPLSAASSRTPPTVVSRDSFSGSAQSLGSMAQITAPLLGGYLIGCGWLSWWPRVAALAAASGLVAGIWGSQRMPNARGLAR